MSTGFCAASAKRMAFIYDLFVFGGLISEIVLPLRHPLSIDRVQTGIVQHF